MHGTLGQIDDPRFAGRRVIGVHVAWDEASRRRLRRRAENGMEVLIELAHGDYLADGAVLHDDGEQVVVVVRRPEPALVVHFDRSAPPQRLVAGALALGHALGNQHVPVELDGWSARAPLTTSEEVARATVAALDLESVSVEIADVALGASRPLASHAHHPH